MKIKEIKIINQDESTEIADIGADAINVDYNDTTVKAELDKLDTDNEQTKNNITNLQLQVSSLAPGGPAGVYATVAALTSADPDHSKIYIVTEDGHWYYYNNGWQNGGIYQAVSESKSITDIYNLIYNIIPKNSSAWEQGIYNDTDWTKTNSDWGIRLIDPLTFSKKGVYHVKTDDTYRIKIRLFNENDEIIYPGTTWITEETYIAINDNISYAKIHIGRKDGNKINVNVIPNVLISITYRPELSMKNLNEYHYGTLLNGSYTPSMVRMVTDFIPVDSNTAIHWAINDKYITQAYIYDETKTTVIERAEYSSHGILVTRATKKYVRFLIKNNIVPDGVILPSEIDLKISFTPKDYVRKNLITTTNWENGTLSSEGEEIDNQWSYQRLRSDFIPVYSKHYYRYYIGNTHQLAVYAYDENKNFLYQIIDYMTYNHEINGFNGFVRYVMKNTDSTAITPEDIDTCNIRVEEVTTSRANSIEAKRLKIMTNNVGHFSYGVGVGYDGNDIENQIQNWINLYKNQNPDILGIQEFWPIFERTQDHAMGIYKTRQSIYQKIFNDVFTGLFDMGIASNFEIINIESGMLGANDRSQARAYMHITYNINGKELHFFNIHAHPSDATIRATQFDELITILNQYDTFICTGDYNADFASEYDPFKTAGFNLANCGNFGEFYTFIHGDKPLDNIICSPNISINNVQKIDSNVTSDHYALVADIVIPLFDINY